MINGSRCNSNVLSGQIHAESIVHLVFNPFEDGIRAIGGGLFFDGQTRVRGKVIGKTVRAKLTTEAEAKVPNAWRIVAIRLGCPRPGKSCADAVQSGVDARQGRSTKPESAVASGEVGNRGRDSKIDASPLRGGGTSEGHMVG